MLLAHGFFKSSRGNGACLVTLGCVNQISPSKYFRFACNACRIIFSSFSRLVNHFRFNNLDVCGSIPGLPVCGSVHWGITGQGHIRNRGASTLGALQNELLRNHMMMGSVRLLAREMGITSTPIPTAGLVISTVLSMLTMAILAVCLSELHDTTYRGPF
jgi:hypothetical protein